MEETGHILLPSFGRRLHVRSRARGGGLRTETSPFCGGSKLPCGGFAAVSTAAFADFFFFSILSNNCFALRSSLGRPIFFFTMASVSHTQFTALWLSAALFPLHPRLRPPLAAW